MKPPKVSKKLWEGRQPLGHLRNSLPTLYCVLRDNGEFWIMQNKSTGEATGAQVCLAIIDAGVMQVLLAPAKYPYELVIARSPQAPPAFRDS